MRELMRETASLVKLEVRCKYINDLSTIILAAASRGSRCL